MRQMVVCFALFYTMKWRKSFYASLSTTSSPQINPKMTSSIFMTNYSPLSSERGWGWGFVCLPSFNFHLSTTSPPLINPQTLPSISTTNYSPLSSENHRSLFVKPAKRGKQRAGGEALFPSIYPPNKHLSVGRFTLEILWKICFLLQFLVILYSFCFYFRLHHAMNRHAMCNASSDIRTVEIV